MRFIPKSRITFREDGEPVLTGVTKSVPAPRGAGVDLDALLGSKERSAEEEAMWTPIEELPVYRYEDSYVAAEGAVAQYGSGGELCHVWGDCEYTSNIGQYEVDGDLPNGRYIGNFSEFSQETIVSRDAYANKQSGRFSTYGNIWPKISPDDEKPSNGIVPDRDDGYYGDRIGTKNNVLRICDVAVKKANYNSLGYDCALEVHIMASDTNGSGDLSHTMYIRDKMGEEPTGSSD